MTTPVLTPVAKTQFLIGTTTTTASNDTFTTIGSVMDGGTIGAAFKDIAVETIGDSQVRHLKGTEDPGVMTLKLAQDLTDAGQLALLAALSDQTNDYNIRFILPNKLTSTGTGLIIDVKGKVTAFNTELPNPNSVVGATVQLGLNSIRTFTSAT
jgi:hypothetical protein